jgi:dihydroorotate dehydrogenase electron transfer subunit
MMKAVADICRTHGIRNQASLESHMACGIGACVGCVTNIRSGGEDTYKLVCKDGPVFDSEDVIW